MSTPLLPALGRINVLATAAIVLTSCAFTSRIISTTPADRPIPSLKCTLDNASKCGGVMRVFMVHGMSNHPYGPESRFQDQFGASIHNYATLLEYIDDPVWREQRQTAFIKAISDSQFEPLIPKLAAALGLTHEEGQELHWLTAAGGTDVLGYQLKRRFRGVRQGKQTQIVFYINSWAHTCLKAKTAIRTLEDYPERQYPSLNRSIKDSLVTWGLMDAALYVGANRQRMEKAVESGLTLMWRDSLQAPPTESETTPDRFAFVSASLGSIICLNTLTKVALSHQTPKVSSQQELSPTALVSIFANEPPLHMLANQVPLLEEAMKQSSASVNAAQRADPSHSGGSLISPQAEALASFASALSQLGRRSRSSLPLNMRKAKLSKLNVIAYTDPADLLSFQIDQDKLPKVPEMEIILTNVLVRNPAMGIRHWATDPRAAHTGFDNSPSMVKLMVTGRH